MPSGTPSVTWTTTTSCSSSTDVQPSTSSSGCGASTTTRLTSISSVEACREPEPEVGDVLLQLGDRRAATRPILGVHEERADQVGDDTRDVGVRGAPPPDAVREVVTPHLCDFLVAGVPDRQPLLQLGVRARVPEDDLDVVCRDATVARPLPVSPVALGP